MLGRAEERLRVARLNAALLATILVACGSLDEGRRPAQKRHDHLDPPARISAQQSDPYLAVLQEGRRSAVRDGDRLTVSPRPFGLVFPLLHYDGARGIFHSVQIAGSASRSFLDLDTGLPVDHDNHGLVLFAPGTGMASDAEGRYPVFFLEENHAHHYIVYEPGNPEARRAEPIRTLNQWESEVRFDVSHFKYNGRTFTVGELPLKELYFVVLMDRNRNGVMDEGELFRFTLVLR